jgi:hypothetical protein
VSEDVDKGGTADAGAVAETREAKPCCKRVRHDTAKHALYGWCLLADGHDGECGGALSEPVISFAPTKGKRR